MWITSTKGSYFQKMESYYIIKRQTKKSMEQKQKITHLLLLVAIVVAAFFLRTYNITGTPAGVYPDESVNGTDALHAIETGQYHWFYTNNYGREGLFMNLISISTRLLGNNVYGLKIWSMIFGTLTVLGLYLLTRELFRSPRAGLIAAYLTAFSFWHINFSRISFRAIMLPMILTYTFYFLYKGLHTKKFQYFIYSGLIYGIGLHTYIAFRLSPAILPFFLVFLIISHQNFLKNYWKQIVLFIFAILVTSSPILYDFYKHPDHFSSRTGAVSVFSPEINKGHPLALLAKNFGLSLAKYNFWGDQNWRHNYPPYPILDPITGAFFLFGIVYTIIKFLHLFYLRIRHKVRDEKLAIYGTLLIWFLIMLAPEFLSDEGLPHALRAIGTIPVVFIFSTIAFLWFIGKLEKSNRIYKTTTLTVLIIIFAAIGTFNTVKYFYFWANNRNQHGQFNENYKNMSVYLNSIDKELPELHKYLYPNGPGRLMEDGFPVSTHVVRYLTYYQSKPTYITPDTKIESPAVIVLMGLDLGYFDGIKKQFPRARLEKIDMDQGFPSDFFAILINK
jgi:4-amino-4-deoxy-L-arabinose transferase-like glycosyltransferase